MTQQPLNQRLFMDLMGECPVIPEVKNEAWLNDLLSSDSQIAYILYGDICTIPKIVSRVKAMGKYAIVHVDLIDGLASKSIAADFIKQYTEADGIISTKPALIDRANQIGLFTVQRFFMMDGITYANITRYVKQNDPDVVELMPSGLSKLIKYLVELISQPVVASGLTQDSEDIIRALSAGAVGVATSNKELWQC